MLNSLMFNVCEKICSFNLGFSKSNISLFVVIVWGAVGGGFSCV